MERCRLAWPLLGFISLLAAAWNSADPPAPRGARAARPAERDEVAAVVNGERIMLSELIGRLDEVGIPPDRRDQAAPEMLDTLVDNTLLVQFLAAQKVPHDARAIEAELAELRGEAEKQGGSLAATLARLGMTEEKLRQQAVALARWDNYCEKQVTDKKLADFLARHREFFDGSQVRASHILVELPTGADAAARSAAKSKIERIRRELAAGQDFAAAAKKYSDCPSKSDGGDVGWFPRDGKMVEPFARAAFALKAGETSGIVDTPFGYHLIRVTDRKTGKLPPLDPVRDKVRQGLAEEMKGSIIAAQRKIARIEIAPGVPSPETGSAQPGPTAAKARAKSSAPRTSSSDSSKSPKKTPPAKR